MAVDNEKVFRAIVRSYVERYVQKFSLQDYVGIINKTKNDIINKRHESDY